MVTTITALLAIGILGTLWLFPFPEEYWENDFLLVAAVVLLLPGIYQIVRIALTLAL